MRQLTEPEQTILKTFFDLERKECKNCRYTARIDGRIQCGLLYYDCLVTKPVCLEVK